jgi:hypothetical protein
MGLIMIEFAVRISYPPDTCHSESPDATMWRSRRTTFKDLGGRGDDDTVSKSRLGLIDVMITTPLNFLDIHTTPRHDPGACARATQSGVSKFMIMTMRAHMLLEQKAIRRRWPTRRNSLTKCLTTLTAQGPKNTIRRDPRIYPPGEFMFPPPR